MMIDDPSTELRIRHVDDYLLSYLDNCQHNVQVFTEWFVVPTYL
jgi:hypothetical protein